jgi:myo-inositol-1(or 4)-monophosphatase
MNEIPSEAVALVETLDHRALADMVRQASRSALDWYRRPPSQDVENKSADGFDPVTVADRAVEARLRDELRQRFPGHAILGEEFGLEGDGPWQWTIDPIDGTRAFITGQPMWGTLVGLSFERRPLAGWMHVPVLDETFRGSIVGGSTADGRPGVEAVLTTSEDEQPLAVTTTEALSSAVVLCTHPSMFAAGAEAERFQAVADAARMVRYSGDCVNYGLLAMGLADAVVENQLAPYDIAPLIPIVEGAGGVITDLDGNLPVDGGYVVAAATESLHRDLLGRLR